MQLAAGARLLYWIIDYQSRASPNRIENESLI